MTPRAVSIEKLRGPRTLAQTDVGEYHAVAIADLQFDPDVQRHLDTGWVEARVGEYDMVAAGQIQISRRRSGALFVIDGQHRTMLALRCGETHILGTIHDGLSKKEEAALRIKFNDTRQDTAQEKFKTRLTARDPVALGVRKVVTEAGGKIGISTHGPRHINAVAGLEKVYRLDDGKTLAVVLAIQRAAFDVLDGSTCTVPSLQGLAHFVRAHNFDEKRLIERLSLVGARALIREMHGHKAAVGGSAWVNYYRAVLSAYNYRLAPSKRIEWAEPGSRRR